MFQLKIFFSLYSTDQYIAIICNDDVNNFTDVISIRPDMKLADILDEYILRLPNYTSEDTTFVIQIINPFNIPLSIADYHIKYNKNDRIIGVFTGTLASETEFTEYLNLSIINNTLYYTLYLIDSY